MGAATTIPERVLSKIEKRGNCLAISSRACRHAAGPQEVAKADALAAVAGGHV
jgi:hypothetical protein